MEQEQGASDQKLMEIIQITLYHFYETVPDGNRESRGHLFYY
ncbi:hypothetical protein [Brevibacillus laterosporus]|nr:hypothetical protein [Brevibacillus laterosporus]MED1669150.1 hypothetical protein [Brevibacillus laterosporus]MED1717576.1 hypothetical protein [Brevibacillus laterosporus]